VGGKKKANEGMASLNGGHGEANGPDCETKGGKRMGGLRWQTDHSVTEKRRARDSGVGDKERNLLPSKVESLSCKITKQDKIPSGAQFEKTWSTEFHLSSKKKNL